MSILRRRHQLVAGLVWAVVPAFTFAGDGAQVVSADLPSAMSCGSTTTARVTMRNNGTTTWTADVFKLGAAGDGDELGGPVRVYLPDGATVPPGCDHTFNIPLTAPGSERIATTDWRMVHEGVAWFGATASRSVSVTCSPGIDNAQIIGSDLPTVLACGQSFDASVAVRNTGGTTWTSNVYKLGAKGDGDDLGGPGRIYLPAGTQVPPGGQHTFHFKLTAPSEPAAALTDWRMVHEGGAWFGATAGSAVTVDCGDPIDDSIVVSSDLPDFLQCGERYPATVRMRNTGTTPWTSEVYKLGAVGDNDLLGGPLRVYLPDGAEVPPGGEHTFSFDLTAPYDMNGAPSKWRMVHEGDAWFGSTASTWADLDCYCAEGGCAAGCAYVPSFTVSTTRIPTGEKLTFSVASPDTILDDLPNWDFGDGNHCEHCPRTVTHRYTEPGVYPARHTATESRGGMVLVSAPIEIDACDHAVPRHTAEIIETDFPTALCAADVEASVTVKNIGHGNWEPGEFFLGAVGNSDPFSYTNRIPLTRLVAPQEVYTFRFPLRRATDGCPFSPCRTEWQMVWEEHFWFGGRAQADIETTDCPTSGEGDYTCSATAHDEYQRPLQGKAVVLETFVYGESKWEVVDRAFSVTDGNGRAVVGMDVTEPATRLRCLVDLQAAGRNTTGYVVDPEGLPSGAHIEVAALAIPEPTFSVGAVGLKGASAVGHLYQSGDYDRVIVIPEPFDSNELVKGPRGREGLWDELQPFLIPLYESEFDVWVVNPPSTGQNIHEQAAEFAQILEFATGEYPATIGAGPEFDGRAAAVGISLGGVVSRIATSRWESRAGEDAAWRSQLGLADTLPLKLIVFVDSPLRGANVPRPLQSFLWKPFGFPKSKGHEINMNSCAFQQLVKETSWQLVNCSAGLPNPTCNWRAFYEDGREVRFPGFGTCDARAGDTCICDPGPAVFSINGDGFAHGPRTIAYTDGAPGEPNRCYGDHRDVGRDGKNMCGSNPRARVLNTGDEWLKLDVNNFPDEHFHLRQSDLVPGSRLPSLDGRTFAGIPAPFLDKIKAFQFSSPTFIPLTSALGSGNESCAFFDCKENTFNGAHVNPSKEAEGWLFGHVAAAFGLVPPPAKDRSLAGGSLRTELGEALALDAEIGDSAAIVTWELGDGTVRSGASIAHTYDRAGIYPIRLSVEHDDRTTSSMTSVRVGVPENKAPEIAMMGNRIAGPGESIELVATATDAETAISRTFWNFGDGSFGEGLRTSHAWSEPGTYTVVFTATDVEGTSGTAEFSVSVGTPGAPDAVAPVMEGAGVYPAFLWRPVAGATAYTIRVISGADVDAGLLSVSVPEPCAAAMCWATLDDALDAGDHFWSVSASNQYGEGPPSDWAQFRVQTARNNSPTVGIDSSGACGANCSIDFVARAHDSDGHDLGYAWSGCGEGEETSLTCVAEAPGVLGAAVAVTDAAGATATAESSVPVFAASFSVGEWGGCSAECGGGTQTRTVEPSSLTLAPPGVDPPAASRQCNTRKCALTCYDYTNMYPRKRLCYAAGWRVCERRYRVNGVGGTLSCWKGFK